MIYASTQTGFRIPQNSAPRFTPGAFVMCGGDAVLTTDTEPEQAEDFVDDFLRLVAHIRAGKHRDPLRALEDALLDLRVRVG